MHRVRWFLAQFGVLVVCLIGAAEGSAHQRGTQDLTARADFENRMEKARAALSKEGKSEGETPKLAQWYNWGNWPNWNNWRNWFNWLNS